MEDTTTLIAVDTATVPVEIEDGTVSFTVDPNILQQGLKEALTGIKQASNVLFFAVTGDDASTVFAEHAIAPEIGNGRLIIGAQGNGLTYAFVDIPVQDVESEGIFITLDGDKLQKYASNSTDPLKIKYVHSDDPKVYIELDKDIPNAQNMPTRLPYDDDESGIDLYFRAASYRFDTPLRSFSESGMQALLQQAARLRASKTCTQGELSWEENIVRFSTFQPGEKHGVFTYNRAELFQGLDAGDAFEWETPADELKVLKDVASLGTGTWEYIEGYEDDDQNEVPPVFQLAYSKSLGPNKSLYAHRQFVVTRENTPVKLFEGNLIFAQQECRLFSTVTTNQFFDAISRMHALDEAALLSLEMGTTPTGHEVLEIIGGDPNEPSSDAVLATHGTSQLSQLLVNQSVLSVMRMLIDTSHSFQIFSYPHDLRDDDDNITGQQEYERGMVIVPLPLGEDPDTKPIDPETYMVVFWQ